MPQLPPIIIPLWFLYFPRSSHDILYGKSMWWSGEMISKHIFFLPIFTSPDHHFILKVMIVGSKVHSKWWSWEVLFITHPSTVHWLIFFNQQQWFIFSKPRVKTTGYFDLFFTWTLQLLWNVKKRNLPQQQLERRTNTDSPHLWHHWNLPVEQQKQ